MSGAERARDAVNPDYMFQTTDTALLVQAVNGEIDLQALAARELASRGLDKHGHWVGFDRARDIHGFPAPGTIAVDTREYVRSHGKQPRGFGQWLFRVVEDDGSELGAAVETQGYYSVAVKAAREQAALRRGAYAIVVLP